MKMQKFACALFVLVFLSSCSDDSLPEAEPILNMQKISDRIGMEDAMILVEEARALLDEESPSESRSSRAVNSVSALVFGDVKASAMKSGKYKDLGVSDTLAYVFNFGDSSGYAIVSKDKRVETPLLAFTKKGSLINGKTDNPGLALFLERLEGYVLESIAKSGKGDEKKEVMEVVQRGPSGSMYLITVLKPLVPVAWGQNSPFWNKLKAPQCHSGYYLAGCGATATAHIMSRWEYPTTLNSITSYDWALLNKFKNTDDFFSSGGSISSIAKRGVAILKVADLFEQIGKKNTGIDMEYGCDVSWSSIITALSFLESKGFTLYGNSYIRNYNFAFVGEVLNKQIPLMARACTSNGQDCHIWVIDGLASMFPSLVPSYLHNNWGWDGRDNGYYLKDVFDPFAVPLPYQNLVVGAVYR